MQGIELRALEIFRTVAAEGSISKAAARLNRVQSNISTRVKQLEQHLGKQLFVRQKSGLTLTPDGVMLLPYAERLLQLSAEASEVMAEGRPSGAFRIGAMESTAAARLPQILSRYQQRHGDVQIELVTDTAGGLMDRLLGRDIECAFVAEPVDFNGVSSEPVFQEQLVLTAPKSFPPLQDAEQISGRTVIAFETGCAYRRYLDEWLLHAGIVPGAVMSVNSYLAILASVSAGTGFALIPQSVLDLVTSLDDYRCCRLPGKLSAVRTMLAWRSDYRSAKLDALKALLPACPARVAVQSRLSGEPA